MLRPIAGALVLAALLAATGAAADPIPITRLTHIYGVAADPDDPERLYLASDRGFFVAARDGMADLVSASDAAVMGFAASPQRDGFYYAAAATGVRASLDFGKSWSAVPGGADAPGPFLALHISAPDPVRVYGVAGNVYRSDDGGVRWADLGPPPAPIVDIAASPFDREVVFLGTVRGLFVSSDAGASWQLALPGERPATLVETGGGGSVYAFVAGTGLLRTSGPGGAWETVTPASAFDGALIHMAVGPGGLVVVTQFMKVLVSADGGATWESLAR